MEVIEKPKVHFRIQIYDLKKNKSKLISLTNHEGYTAVDLQRFFKACLNDKSITDKHLKKN